MRTWDEVPLCPPFRLLFLASFWFQCFIQNEAGTQLNEAGGSQTSAARPTGTRKNNMADDGSSWHLTQFTEAEEAALDAMEADYMQQAVAVKPTEEEEEGQGEMDHENEVEEVELEEVKVVEAAAPAAAPAPAEEDYMQNYPPPNTAPTQRS